jgi:hypothetical protein
VSSQFEVVPLFLPGCQAELVNDTICDWLEELYKEDEELDKPDKKGKKGKKVGILDNFVM